jgi:hypothetical protein
LNSKVPFNGAIYNGQLCIFGRVKFGLLPLNVFKDSDCDVRIHIDGDGNLHVFMVDFSHVNWVDRWAEYHELNMGV